MTYYVFGGTLNLAQSINQSHMNVLNVRPMTPKWSAHLTPSTDYM